MDSKEIKIYISVIIAVVVLAIILTFFIITMVKHHRNYRKLSEERLRAEIETLEKERARISADLHDDFGPTLSTVKMQINNLEFASDADKQNAAKLSTYVDSLMSRVRAISNNLLPAVLQRKGFAEALEKYADELSVNSNIPIEMRVFSDSKIADDKKVHLYRIGQEILHNAVKYSKASKITVLLKENELCHFLVISDNGVGFDAEFDNKESKGLGLRNIKSRVEFLEGKMEIESKKNKGTTFTIVIAK